MRVVGKHLAAEIYATASGAHLKRAAAFNELLQASMPNGNQGYIPKGIYRFKTHIDANKHQDDCLVAHLVRIADGLKNER